MNELEVWLDDASLGVATLVGHLHRNTSKTGDTLRFDYAQAWIENSCEVTAFALDHELSLVSGAHYASTGADQLSGIFLDCSPDRWGKMLMERRRLRARRALVAHFPGAPQLRS
jgi:serine/threonine-protein kinase HipA